MSKKIIGLTGSIATGKSTVARMFLDEGIYVIDSDMLAKEVTNMPEVLQKIEAVFGPEAIDANGQMDRAFVADIVFCSMDLRLKLNGIVHPIVKKQIVEIVENRKNKMVVVDVPLMYETDFHEMMDEIIVVYATPEQQVERLMGRNQYTREQAELRVASQMSIDEKVAKADYVLDNTGIKMDLYKNFKELLKQLRA